MPKVNQILVTNENITLENQTLPGTAVLLMVRG
jgi:hypothetical protein